MERKDRAEAGRKNGVVLSFALYAAMWFMWALREEYLLPLLGAGRLPSIIDGVVLKFVVWVLPFLILGRLRRSRMFEKGFPWLACVILLCAVAVYLHTLRLYYGLLDTHIIFDPIFILFSASAGVLEEISFRAGFFDETENVGVLPAALLNGAMFTGYHFPFFSFAGLRAALSVRGLTIFVMGVIFCLMYKKWRNIALNITVHTVWDILCYLFCLVG